MRPFASACTICMLPAARAGLLGLWLAFCAGPSAAAQSQPSPDPGEYKELVREAVDEFSAGNWPESLALFKRAHELEPNARTLRGMGIASFEMRDYVQAIGYLQTALADHRRPLTAEQRTQVQALIERAQNFVARFRIEVYPQRATLLVDGREVPLGEAHELMLNSGAREIVVEAEGFDALRRTIEAEPGETRELRLVLRPARADEPGGEPTDPSSSRPLAAPARDQPAPAKGRNWRTGAWVSAAASLAFAGSGTAFYLTAGSKFDDIQSSCASGCTSEQARARVEASNGETYDALAIASFALSGVALATAVTLFLVSRSPRAEVQVGVGPASLSLRGSF